MPRPPFLAPFLIIVGAVLLILTAGTEVAGGVRAWLAGNAELPRELILHTLVAGAALLLAAAVLITRRSMQRQIAAEAALRQSEERMRLVANNVPALISYVDRDQRYRFSNRTYDAWFGISARAHDRAHRRRGVRRGRLRAHAPGHRALLDGQTVEFEFTNGEGGQRRTMQVAVRAAPRPATQTARGARLLHAGERRHRAQARAGGPALRRGPAAARRAAPRVPRAPRHAHRPAQPRDVRRPRARGGGARAAPRQDRGVPVPRHGQLQAGERRPRPRRRRRPAQGDRPRACAPACAATTSSRASAATSSACCCRRSPSRARPPPWRRSCSTSSASPTASASTR